MVEVGKGITRKCEEHFRLGRLQSNEETFFLNSYHQ